MCDDCQKRLGPATDRALAALTTSTNKPMLIGCGPIDSDGVGIAFYLPVTGEEREALRVDLGTLVGASLLDVTLDEILGGRHGD